jgi:hypothetical protein
MSTGRFTVLLTGSKCVKLSMATYTNKSRTPKGKQKAMKLRTFICKQQAGDLEKVECMYA